MKGKNDFHLSVNVIFNKVLSVFTQLYQFVQILLFDLLIQSCKEIEYKKNFTCP